MALQRQLAAPAYLVGFALLCIPPFDAIMQVLPVKPGDPRWRWGTFGLLSNAMMIPLTGFLIAFVVASIFEHHRTKRLLGLVAILVAVVTAGGFVIFGLDALQIRRDVNPEAQLAFKVATSTAALKSVLGVLTFAMFALAAFRGPKPARAGKPSKTGGGLLLGARAPGAAAPGIGADRTESRE